MMFTVLTAVASAYPMNDREVRMKELGELLQYGVTTVTEVAERRERNAADPLPFLLGDTLGIADLHAHPLTELGFDHRVVVSNPAPCDGRWHGLRYDLTRLLSQMPELVGDPVVGGLMRHCPKDDYPAWRNWTHEQYGLASLKQAHKDGLSLMVMSAMSNQLLCAIASDYSPDMDDFHIWWPERRKLSQCADDVNIHRQLRAAWQMEKEHTWLEIALTPGQANHAMAAGRLVWLLGIEGSDYLGPKTFGGIAGEWSSPEREPTQTAELVYKRLDRMGVRVVLATHEWNNAIGGSALQHLPLFEAGYNLIRRWRREDEWTAVMLLEQMLLFKTHYDRGEYSRFPMRAVRSDMDDPTGRERHDRQLLINAQGLSDYGKELVRKVLAPSSMMMLDLTHLSERAIQDTKDLAVGPAARVLISHSYPRTLASDDQDSLEYPISDATYTWAVEKGGTIGFLPGANAVQSSPGSPVPNTCPGSARSHAQTVHWLSGFTPFVAVGTDMNGAAVESVPRYGPFACTVDVSPEKARQLRLAECLASKELPADDDVSQTGIADIASLPAYMLDIEHLGVPTRGTWFTAQRVVDTWSGVPGAKPVAAEAGSSSPAPTSAPSGTIQTSRTIAGNRWTARPPIHVKDVTRATFRRCGSEPESWLNEPGMQLVQLPLDHWDVTVDTWSGRYPAWYAAAMTEAQSGDALVRRLRDQGIGVTVDADGNLVSAPLTAREVSGVRKRPSDECKPKDVKEIVR